MNTEPRFGPVSDDRRARDAAFIHNQGPIGLTGYRAMLEADTAAISDLQFFAELLVAEADVVACRLVFQCTPQQPFLGFEPTGAQISFSTQDRSLPI